MQKRYETVFILTPVLSDVQVKETVDKFKKIISDSEGKVLHEEDWGLKKMAYAIQKKSTGFYQLLEFESTNNKTIDLLEVAYRRDERVMRYLTVALDKHAVEYGEKRRIKIKEGKSKVTTK